MRIILPLPWREHFPIRAAAAVVAAILAGAQARGGMAMQTIFLDFDSFTDTGSGERTYSTALRDAIEMAMETHYAAWPFTFAQTTLTGTFATVFFNARAPGTTTTATTLIGGDASDIDWLNLDLGGTAEVNITNLLTDGPSPIGGALVPTDANIIGLSAFTASHEFGHLLGLRHWDSFGPPGTGLPSAGPAPATYAPMYPGPTAAAETVRHIMNPGPVTGQTLADAAGTVHFGEREAIRISGSLSGTVTPETMAPHSSPITAQALVLSTIAVPNTLLAGDTNFSLTLTADLALVTGTLAAPGGIPEEDWYSFTGTTGDLMNLETVAPPDRFTDPSTLTITLFDPMGMPLVSNSSTFEAGSHILDFTLPSSGTFFISLTAIGFPAAGEYGLSIYRFEAVPEPATWVLLLAGPLWASRRQRAV